MREVQWTEIEKCQAQDAKVLGDVFQRLHPPLISLCYRYLGSLNDSEDVLMVSWMKVLERIQSFKYEHPLSFYAWIKRICVNECLGILRKRNNFHLLPLEELPSSQEPVATPEWSDFDAQLLLKLVADLPEGYRTVFNLFAIEGYSHAEIAKLLNISESTSKSQLRKARLSLIQRITTLNKSRLYCEK
jgi:RNA polymerase sigma-70 factor (ECF subfamily)